MTYCCLGRSMSHELTASRQRNCRHALQAKASKQMLSLPWQVPAVQEYIKDLLDSDQKFLAFAHHTSLLDGMETAFRKCAAFGRRRPSVVTEEASAAQYLTVLVSPSLAMAPMQPHSRRAHLPCTQVAQVTSVVSRSMQSLVLSCNDGDNWKQPVPACCSSTTTDGCRSLTVS